MSNDIENVILETFPDHKGELSIHHNPHKTCYDTPSSYAPDLIQWVSEDEQIRAEMNDEMWEVTWYPESSVGHCSLYASTLAAIVDAMKDE